MVIFLLKDNHKEGSEHMVASKSQKELGIFKILLLVVVGDIHNFGSLTFHFEKSLLSFLMPAWLTADSNAG